MKIEVELSELPKMVSVIEVQYTEGALLRKVYMDEEEAERAWAVATTRASADWANLYEVEISGYWFDPTEWRAGDDNEA